MIKTATYRCGHTGEVPANFGRGKARYNRIAAYFGSDCPECRRKRTEAFARRLSFLLPGTDANGKRLTRPYTEEEVARYVAKHTKT